MAELQTIYEGTDPVERERVMRSACEEATSRGLTASLTHAGALPMLAVLEARAVGSDLSGEDVLRAVVSAAASIAVTLWHTHIANAGISNGLSDAEIEKACQALPQALGNAIRLVEEDARPALRRALKEIREDVKEAG